MTITTQDTAIRRLPLADIQGIRSGYGRSWQWSCPFVTPPWLSAWWQIFGREYEPLLLLVEVQGTPIGLAPLLGDGRTARIIGSEDLCDHVDFPVETGMEEIFFQTLLRHLRDVGIDRLVIDPVRPDSLVLCDLVPVARTMGGRVALEPNGVAVEMPLPNTWEEYLGTLTAKQRHEVRRKFRRAAESGEIDCRLVKGLSELPDMMDVFLDFFRQSRSDKDAFMTSKREKFFRLLANELARAQMLNLFRIEIDSQPAAVVFCIVDGSVTYLYNNGFNPHFSTISIGAVSKLMTIQASIEAGKAVYDFLNGAERYKYQLGGTEVELSTCTIEM
ncbi:MAG: GNAT family N-acetyltransferase [Desulforhopalus sp.]